MNLNSIRDVTRLAHGPVLQLINWLQAHNVLAPQLICVPCQRDMTLTPRNIEHVDGYQWYAFICSTQIVFIRTQVCRLKWDLSSLCYLCLQEMPRMPLQEDPSYRQFLQWISANFVGKSAHDNISMEYARAAEDCSKDVGYEQEQHWKCLRSLEALLREGLGRSTDHSIWRTHLCS